MKNHPIARKMIAQDLSVATSVTSASKSKVPSSVNPPANNQEPSILMTVAGVVAVTVTAAVAIVILPPFEILLITFRPRLNNNNNNNSYCYTVTQTKLLSIYDKVLL
jgi:hypothetical protein